MRHLLGVLVLLAALFGGLALWGLLRDREDPGRYRLELQFRSARGLKPGAAVQYRGYRVGEVATIRLAPDGNHALVEIALEAQAAATVRTGSEFWIVTPRFQGVAGGASGLETLIKDSYVAYATPAEGRPLPTGSRVPGAEDPPDEVTAELEEIMPGDLVFQVVFARNHGLAPGARVRHRGVVTGEVRRVDLAGNGSGVVVEARIKRRYRSTLTDKARVWIARPSLSGSLVSGLSAEELDALFVPYLSYLAPDRDAGQPVVNGARIKGTEQRPDIAPVTPAVADATFGGADLPATRPGGPEERLVRVLFHCIEVDTFDPDDEIAVAGTGLLFRDSGGHICVLAPRSLTDGAFFVTDKFDKDPDIKDEEIKVQLPDGSIHAAGRVWVADGNRDMSILRLPTEAGAGALAGAGPFAGEATPAGEKELQILAAPTGAAAPARRALAMEGKDSPAAASLGLEWLGAALLRGGRIVGCLVRRRPHEDALIPFFFADLPAELRPGDRTATGR